jgi:N utilization substance protein A
VNGSLIQEFESRKGTIVTGVVKRIENNHTVYLEIGKYELPLNEKEQIPGEKFSDGEYVKVCVSEIRKSAKSQEIILTRNSVDFVKRLFEIEIPEIADGTVEIKSVSREAGSRTKVAVYSSNADVDAVGSCIGPKQARINSILGNLKGERIDLIKYSEDPSEFVVASLSPASVRLVEIDKETKNCKVAVATDQLSLAIGKTGQNVRLAARLTGYRIDIISE